MNEPRLDGVETVVCPSCAQDVPKGLFRVRHDHESPAEETRRLPVDLSCPLCHCDCAIGYGGKLIALRGGIGPADRHRPADPHPGIRPASTVILLAETKDAPLETLLVRRNASMKFHGGSWVFPGGGVDEADIRAAVRTVPTDRGSAIALADTAARLAAVREVAEETGLTVGQERLDLIGHWTTPLGRPRRFSTWFFLARCDKDAVRLDRSELSDSQWITPADALERFSRGEFELPAPTFVSLTTLARASGVDDAVHRARADGMLYVVPRYLQVLSGEIALFPGDASYGHVCEWNSDIFDHNGPQHRLVQDQDGWTYIGPPT